MMEPEDAKPQAPPSRDDAPHPAREMSLHLLRMFETRLDAAGLVAQLESQRLMMSLQLRVLAGAALFLAVWAGIVLLAIVLPEHLRAPVLSLVVGLLVAIAIGAYLAAGRTKRGREVGSLGWLADNLKQDFEVLARTLGGERGADPAAGAPPEPPAPQPGPPGEPHPDPATPDETRNAANDRAA